MGRQRGVVHISGQFGDVQMSIDHGKGLAKLSTPVSKDRIMKDPNYALVRKSMAEFTGASRAVDALYACFGENGNRYGDRYLRSRLIAIARDVVSKGPGANGQRRFEVLANAAQFKGLELNRKEKLGSRFSPGFTVTVNPDRNTADVAVPSFSTTGKMKAPEGATHFRVSLAIGALCDQVYVGGNEVYAPAIASLNGLGEMQESALLPCGDGILNPGFLLTATLPGSPVLGPDAGLAVAVGIEFYVVVNGIPDLSAQGNTMRLVEVF